MFIEESAAVDKTFLKARNCILEYPELRCPAFFTIHGNISIFVKKTSCISNIFRITVILKAVRDVRRNPEHSGAHRLHDQLQCITCPWKLQKDLHHIRNNCTAECDLTVNKDIQPVKTRSASHPVHDILIATDDSYITVSVTMTPRKTNDLIEDISYPVINTGKLSKSNFTLRIRVTGSCIQSDTFDNGAQFITIILN